VGLRTIGKGVHHPLSVRRAEVEEVEEQLTPAFLIISRHFSNAFAFWLGSFDVTKISSGIFPPCRGSKCFAAKKIKIGD
jgi:hypothetical protein